MLVLQELHGPAAEDFQGRRDAHPGPALLLQIRAGRVVWSHVPASQEHLLRAAAHYRHPARKTPVYGSSYSDDYSDGTLLRVAPWKILG